MLDFKIYKRKEDEKIVENEDLKFRFDLILDLAQVGSIFFGLDGMILDCNQHAAKIMGYSCDELIGKEIKFFDESGIFHEHFKENNLLKNHRLKIKRKNGDIGFILVSIYLVKDSDGDKIGYREFFIDITNNSLMEGLYKIINKDERTQVENQTFQNLDIKKFLISLGELANSQKELSKLFKQIFKKL